MSELGRVVEERDEERLSDLLEKAKERLRQFIGRLDELKDDLG